MSKVHLPNGMDPLTNLSFIAPLKNEFLHFDQFTLAPRLKTTRVMEDKSRVATKY